MRVSQSKRGPWLYLFLVLALLVFIGFYTLPLLSVMWKDSSAPSAQSTTVATSQLPPGKQQELEAQEKGYELVLQREPDNNTALRGLMDVRLEQGNLSGAIEPLEKLANLNPEQTEYSILLAQAKQQVGDYQGAIQAYRLILSSQPGNMAALQGMVRLFVLQKMPGKAVDELRGVLKMAGDINASQPGSVDVTSVQLLLGQVYVEQERYKAAIALYDQAIEENQQDWRPVLAKAMVLQQQDLPEEAKPLFTTALSLAPAQYKEQIKQMVIETPAAEAVTPESDAQVVAPD